MVLRTQIQALTAARAEAPCAAVSAIGPASDHATPQQRPGEHGPSSASAIVGLRHPTGRPGAQKSPSAAHQHRGQPFDEPASGRTASRRSTPGKQPARPAQHLKPQQQFASHHGRHETLRKMADAVRDCGRNRIRPAARNPVARAIGGRSRRGSGSARMHRDQCRSTSRVSGKRRCVAMINGSAISTGATSIHQVSLVVR